MRLTRRRTVQLLTASAAVQAAPLLGLLPSPALALPVPPVPPRFFSIEEKVDVTLARIFEGKAIKDSDAITLTAPPIAENGRVVPIEVKFESLMTASGTAFPKNLFIIVDNNRNPLSTSFRFTSATSGGYAACNLRMGETSPVRAIIEMSDGELFGATQRVNVVVGGCGG